PRRAEAEREVRRIDREQQHVEPAVARARRADAVDVGAARAFLRRAVAFEQNFLHLKLGGSGRPPSPPFALPATTVSTRASRTLRRPSPGRGRGPSATGALR